MKLTQLLSLLLLTLNITACSTNNKNTDDALSETERRIITELSTLSKVPDIEIEDQFGKLHKLGESARSIVFAFDMDLAKATNIILAGKPKFLENNKIQYISDISPMPAIISTLFAKPKMRTYAYPILLLNNNEFALTVPKKKDRLTLLVLSDAGIISEIRFLESVMELEENSELIRAHQR